MTGQWSDLARYWMEKAQSSLRSAVIEFQNGQLDFCANRLYYAVFYAVSAALINRGQHYRKHRGVRAALHREYVKTGIIPIRMGTLYDALLLDREEADYMAYAELDPKILQKEITQVREFLDTFSELIQKDLESR